MRFIKALVVLGIWVPWLVSAEEAPEAEKMPEKVSLKVSVQGGAFNAKFKFFDASEGCPSYVDLPGAKHYLGAVFASDAGKTKQPAAGNPVHVFMFSPRDTFGLSAGGGDAEIMRRSLQVVLNSDAALRITGFEDSVPLWEVSGDIDVVPATACLKE